MIHGDRDLIGERKTCARNYDRAMLERRTGGTGHRLRGGPGERPSLVRLADAGMTR